MLDVVQYTGKMQRAWDGFVTASNNGTLFHSRTFLNYHPPDRFKDHSLLFVRKNKTMALLPAIETENRPGGTLVSHSGASFGGFVVEDTMNLRLAHQLVESLLDYSKANGFTTIRMTLPPIFYSRKISNYIEFALIRNKFEYLKREVSSFVTLDFSEDSILQQFRNESRTAVRRAIKLGVEVRPSTQVAEFYKILQGNLNLRHNVKPTHSLAELQSLCKMFPDQIQLYGAYLGKKLIAGVVMFDCNQLVTLAFYVSHDESYQKYRAVNLLFYEIFRRALARGFRYLDFGIFTVNMKPNWGLARFKENFGSMGIFRDTIEWRA